MLMPYAPTRLTPADRCFALPAPLPPRRGAGRMRTAWCITPIARCRAPSASICGPARSPARAAATAAPRCGAAPAPAPHAAGRFRYSRCIVTAPANDETFNAVNSVQAALQIAAGTAGRPPDAGAARRQRLCRLAAERMLSYTLIESLSRQPHAERAGAGCRRPIACAPVRPSTFHVRQPSMLAPARQRRDPTLTPGRVAAGGVRAMTALRESYSSPLSHFEPTELFDTLSTGIVVLDAQLCPIYANVSAQDFMAVSLRQARGRPFADLFYDPRQLVEVLRRSLDAPRDLHAARAGAEGAWVRRRSREPSVHRPDRHAAGRAGDRHLPAAGAHRCHAAAAHLARQRHPHRHGRQPPDDPAAGARGEESAGRTARRGAAARQGTGEPGAARIHRHHHQRSRPAGRAGGFHGRLQRPAQQGRC